MNATGLRSSPTLPGHFDQITGLENARVRDQANEQFRHTTPHCVRGLMSPSEAMRKRFEPSFHEAPAFGRPQRLFKLPERVAGTPHATKVRTLSARPAGFCATCTLPHACVTPVNKHRVAPGHPLDDQASDGQRFIRVRSPCKAGRCKAFSGQSVLPALHEKDEYGYIVSRYLDGNDIAIAH